MKLPPIHPGAIPPDDLAEDGLSANRRAEALHIPTNRIIDILAGTRGVTADTALRLGQYFGTAPELWLNLQKSYELRVAEQQVGQTIRQTISPRPAPQSVGVLPGPTAR